MSIRHTSFRWCMLIGAAALLGVALYYGFGYVGLNIAVANSSLEPFYRDTIRALWLGYCMQATLLGILYLVAAARPHWLSPPVLVICGLLPLAEGVFALSFAGSYWLMLLLFCAAIFVLIGAMLWPKRPEPAAAATADTAGTTGATGTAGAAPAPTGGFTSAPGPFP